MEPAKQALTSGNDAIPAPADVAKVSVAPGRSLYTSCPRQLAIGGPGDGTLFVARGDVV